MSEVTTPEITPEDQRYIDRARGEHKEESVVNEHYQADGTPVESFKMPEKFEGKSAEDIAKAYMELEKLKSKQADSESTVGQNEEKSPKTIDSSSEANKDAPEASTEQVNKTLTRQDFTKYEQSYADNGGLTEGDYKELEAKGLSKEVVDDYIDSLRLKGEVYKNKLYEASQGEEGWNSMIEWARENLTQTQAKRFDDAIKSGNIDDALYEVENIKLRMGTPPRRIEGQSAGDGGGIKPFSTRSEYFEAMRNPAYNKDKGYREMVDSKYIAGRQKGLY
jgi:glutamyl/glutaminyl-tRNA synthetase